MRNLKTPACGRSASSRSSAPAGPPPPVGSTPHSLYAVHPAVLRELEPVSIHFLESAEERRWWDDGKGPLAELIRERGGDPLAAMRAARGYLGTMVEQVDPRRSPRNRRLPVRSGLSDGRPSGRPRLFVHANYVEDAEIDLIRRAGGTVVHCPGSHRFFGHRRFPLERIREARIPVALGTDSLASNTALSMLHEIRLAHESFPELRPDEIVRMATVNGALALGLNHEIGAIRPGMRADLIGVALKPSAPDPYDALFMADRVVLFVIAGRTVPLFS